ncbi:MAG: hypothetical protein FVQ80_17575 [Planctomycetes bacterium]|nr:hypothetical protein [Planctomycetota bacterium]
MSENTILQTALELLDEGISTIPLKPRNKKPILKTWLPYQKRLPTEAEIKKWFTGNNRNLGIICGAVSGNLYVLDFDSSEEGRKFINSHKELLRGALIVKTARGYHVYIRAKSAVKSSKLDGMDIKSGGGYVVGPGSTHPDGPKYKRIRGKISTIPIVDPERLGLLKKGSGKKKKKGWQDELLEDVAEGEQNIRMTELCGRWFGKGLSEEEVKRLALKTSNGWGNHLDEKEVLSVVHSIGKLHKKNKPPSRDLLSRLPRIWAEDNQLPVISEKAWDALNGANKSFHFFVFLRRLVRMVDDGTVEELTNYRLRFELARAAYWFEYNRKDEEIPAKPPLDVVKDMIASSEYPLPDLDRIVHTPVFSPEGVLLLNPGFYEANRIYYVSDGLELPSVFPTVKEACRLIIDDLLVDFPFATEADLANAVALLLIPFARDLIPGPTPFHLVVAAKAGTGKGLLSETLLDIATGGQCCLFPEAKDEEEMRKRITSFLIEGRPAVIFDNLSGAISSGVLSAAITAHEWSDRILGKNETIRIPNRAIWVGTANNPTMTIETARRTVRIRLVAKTEKPWTRTEFKHPLLKRWAKENRGKIVAACLVLISAWVEAGRPSGAVISFGSFEDYQLVIGGILQHAGIKGFLQNHDQLIEETDIQGTALGILTEAWWAKYGDRPVTAKELFPLTQNIEGLDFPQETIQGRLTVFGGLLRKLKDSVFNDFCILTAGKPKNAQAYKLKNLKNGRPDISRDTTDNTKSRLKSLISRK